MRNRRSNTVRVELSEQSYVDALMGTYCGPMLGEGMRDAILCHAITGTRRLVSEPLEEDEEECCN